MFKTQAKNDYKEDAIAFAKKYNIKGFVLKTNDYSYAIYSENEVKMGETKYRLLKLGKKRVTLEMNGMEQKRDFWFSVVLDMESGIDFKSFMDELEKENLVDYKNHIGSIGYNITKNQPIVNKFINDLHWLVVGASGSGKGVLMRTLLLQMAKYPYSEFYIIDKDKDFLNIKDGKKVRFQMDFREIVNPGERFINFLTYLNILMQVRSLKYSKYGCAEWDGYMKKRENEIKKNGKSDMEPIPYITILMDEFQSFRTTCSQTLGSPDIFDKRVDVLLSVCRANGIRVIVGTQDTQKTKIGSALSNVNTRCYYKISAATPPDGMDEVVGNLIKSGEFDKAFVFYLPTQGFIKPAFMDKALMDKETFNAMNFIPNDYTPAPKAKSVMELLLSVANGVDSEILGKYRELFKSLGFKDEEVNEMEKDDSFLTLVALVFFMFKAFGDGLLSNKDLKFVASNSIFSGSQMENGDELPSVDGAIYDYLNALETNKKYAQIKLNIQKIILGNINDDSDESYRVFITTFGRIMMDYYKISVKKADSSKMVRNIAPVEEKEFNMDEAI